MIATLDEIKSFLGISTTANDSQLTTYGQYVTTEIESFINNKIEQVFIENEIIDAYDFDYNKDLEPVLNVNYNEFIVTTEFSPVTSLELTYNGDAISTDDYKLDSDNGVIAIGRAYSNNQQYLKASYTAGLSTIPNDLKMITIEGVAILFENYKAVKGGSGNVTSKSLMDFSVSYGQGDKSVYTNGIKTYLSGNMRILNKYKRLI